MKSAENATPEPGQTVVLTSIPPGLLEGLPADDQEAITAAVGKPLRLLEYDDAGRAELEFTDDRGVIHFICVNPDLIRAFGE